MCFFVLLLLVIFVICLSSYLLNHVFYSWYVIYLLQLFSTSSMSTAFLNFFFLVSLISFIPCSYSPLIVLTCTLTCILFTNDRTGRDNVSVHGISILSLDVRYHWLSESGYMSTKDPERKSSSESNVDRDDITSRYVTPGFKPFSVLNFHWHSIQ